MQKIDNIAAVTLAKFVREGVDMARCIATLSEKQEFNVAGGEFSLFRTVFNTEMTLGAYKNKKYGTVKINSFSDEDVERGIKDCLEVAEASVADEAYDMAPRQGEHKFRDGVETPDLDKFFKRVTELLDMIKTEYPKICVTQSIASYDNEHTEYHDTNGTRITQIAGSYSIMLAMTAVDGAKVTSAKYAWFTTGDLDTPFIEQANTRNEIEETVKLLEAKPLDHKFTGTMVLKSGALASFIEFLNDNYIGSGVIKNKTSQWYGKKGEKVADGKLTVRVSADDPRILNNQHFTDDGFLAENVDIIKNGVLENYTIDLYTAKKTGFEPIKNACMSLIVESGDTSYEDMIKDIDEGIIVGSFSGGHPGVSGEFSGVAKNSFYIKDGKIAGPVSEAMINGNLGEIFNNIRAVSKEVIMNGSMVLPTIAFNGVVVSGK